MELLLSGSGPASGFPVPGCDCAACLTAASGSAGAGDSRRAPARLELPGGWALATDPRSDAALLADPDGRSGSLVAGEQVDLSGAASGWQVRAVDPSALLLHSPSGRSLLWAPQAGRLPGSRPEALGKAAVDVLVIGPAREPVWTDVGFSIARLRHTGAVTVPTSDPTSDPLSVRADSIGTENPPAGGPHPALGAEGPGATDIVLIGQGHRAGPAERLRASLPHWQARIGADGDRLWLASRPASGSPPAQVLRDGVSATAGDRPAPLLRPRRALLLGGASSGKSDLAELLLAADPGVRYLATGPKADPAADADWADRVHRHQDRRPPWWLTVETDDLPAELARSGAPVLLDSVGSWLTGVLDRAGAWHDEPGWTQDVGRRTDALVEAWRNRRGPLVAVSDETGLGVVPATPAGRRFRDELGRLNRRLADESESVTLVVAGRLLPGQ